MSKPYDATTKDLIETDPAGWVAFLGGTAPPDAVRLVDADVSTVSTDADKAIRVNEPVPWLLHLEIQAGRDGSLGRRLLRYNALLHHRHGLPVVSAAVLLRPAANATALTGILPMRPPVGPGWEFRYEVVRVWEKPAAAFLDGPLGLVPFVPLADGRSLDLAALVAAMQTRLDAPGLDRPLSAKLWAASYVLMGLRYDQALIDNVLSGVMQMEESVTYQAIIRRGLEDGMRQGLQQGLLVGTQQGATIEARKMLLIFGEKRLGTPPASAVAAVAAIGDPARLEHLAARLLDVNSWEELLASE
ncbi:MAG: hypothetical protein K2P78_07910 [Gemmataceae bacterium]|nr:hypothetical protein [Gemmataceae bacterium]